MTRERWLWAIGALAIVALGFGIALRFYWLSFHSNPAHRVFDEVYFPVFANDYIKGKDFFDVHPPLGKLIIALGELVYGNNGIGWRIVPCLFGLANIAFIAALYRRLFKENVGALALVGFLSLDGLFIAYSRTGLMDGILFFATFFCVWAASQISSDKLPGLLTAVALGLALAIKWTAVSAIVPMIWYAWQANRLKPFFAWMPLAAVIYFSIVVFGQWRIGAAHPVAAALEWHWQAAHYHLTLQKDHPWGSHWWSWPIEMRPVLFIYDRFPGGAQVMTTLANPLLLWGTTVVVIGTCVWYGKKRSSLRDPEPSSTEEPALALPYEHSASEEPVVAHPRPASQAKTAWQLISSHPTFPLMLGFFATWLEFAPVHRIMFFYHYMPAYGFGLLLIAYWIGVLAKRSAAGAFAICAAAALMAWYMMPLAVGYPKLTQNEIKYRTIVPSWF